MFIFIGSRKREIEPARVEFFRQNCNSMRQFKHLRIADYATIFFLPVYEERHRGDVVECLDCRSRFEPDHVSSEPPSLAYRAVSAARSDLESGTPMERVVDKLAKSMTTRELAKQFVANAAGASLKKCHTCNLTYVDCISVCMECGLSLEPLD